MTASAIISTATLADVPALSDMLSALFTLESDFSPNPEKQTRGLTALIESGNAAVLVARDASGKPMGMVSAQLVISTAQGAPSAWIEDVFILAPYRGGGLGRRLLDAALAWAKSQGATRAQLLVDLDNTPAQKFYEKLGWKTTRLAARQIMI